MENSDLKPKLLIVTDTYYPKVDGTLKFIEEFIKRADQDFEISLLVPYLGIKKSIGNQVNITYLDISNLWHISDYPSIKLSSSNLKKIKNVIKEADIVFIQGPALASYLGIYYSHRYHKKTILYTHTIAWELFEKFFPELLKKLFSGLIRKISIFIYNRCDEILIPYHDLKLQLSEQGIKTEMVIARLGVDTEKFSPLPEKNLAKLKLGISPEKMVIGYVGRISKEKNTLVLLDAFNKLRKRNVFLLMVGDGPEEQTRPFTETKNCLVTGFVDKVEDYLKAMDIFVMPSLTETTSLATLEAMSSGLPVVATKVGFIKKYIVKDHNGIFFPRNSPSMLAIKIEKLLKDKEFREKLSQNARKTITYSFSWDRSINRIKRLLKKDYT